MATLPKALGLSVCQENHMPWRLMSRAPWNNISGGSPHPEWWLSNSGQVAQTAPEYSYLHSFLYYHRAGDPSNVFISMLIL
jgi:hypothetical protein